MSTDFATRVLLWFEEHGRKDLPWQHDTSPYRVWVSEIMLQQTQVTTVIPYYERFMEVFPTVQDLAAADEDTVLHHWTGLGYYARARNLHKAAKRVANDLDGEFPDSLDGLCELPGVGRSTAGAILSIATGQRASILDGNVKRVLARHHRVTGWPGHTPVQNRLWEIAEQYTPQARCADYTQAMMDLGATLCTRSKPGCVQCPLNTTCEGFAAGDLLDYPGKKPRTQKPVKATHFLIAHTPDNEVWLEKRPAPGIWGGLWCFPEATSLDEATRLCLHRWGPIATGSERLTTFRHTFSHYHLDITPVLVRLEKRPNGVMEDGVQLWYNLAQAPQIGLAAPVVNLLTQLAESQSNREF